MMALSRDVKIQGVRMRGRALGAMVLAVIAYSASSLLVRAGRADPVVFNAWRLWLAVPPLAAIVAWRKRRNPALELWPAKMSKGHVFTLLLGGGALFAAGASAAFVAIDRTRLLDVTLITSLQPVVVIVFAVVALRERLTAKRAAAAGAAVLGTLAVAAAGSSDGTWTLGGDLIAVCALVLYAGWFLYGRALRARFAMDPFALILGVLAPAAALLTPVALLMNGGLQMNGRGFEFAAYTMVAGTTAHVLVVWAHPYIPAAVSAPLLLAQPPIVALGAWLWFGEELGATEIVGSTIVLVALVAVVRAPAVERVDEETADPVAPT
jgi:drug/metabolite transporter (DMT)-like permease